MAASIQVEKVSKTYDDGTRAVSELDLDVAEGEFVVFVGPSGCGKTTLLRMIAGLDHVTSGDIRIDGVRVNNLPPKARDVAMVFQNYALYPNLSVADNMGFALKVQRLERRLIRDKVEQTARILGLADLLAKRPRALSGGQRQRVAMGRAIIREPQVFLMDEPLSNLDAKLRVQMRAEIARIQRDLAVTTIYVTHDQSEAMTLGDKVAIMRNGHLHQFAPPSELYTHPANLFVAGFIGSPSMNVVEATLTSSDDHLVASFGSHQLRVPHERVSQNSPLRHMDEKRVALGIRPEDIEDATLVFGNLPNDGTCGQLTATVDIKEDLGAEVYLHFSIDAPAPQLADLTTEDDGVAPAETELVVGTPFVARVGRTTAARETEQVRLAIDTTRLYLFDLDTGKTLLSPAS